MASDLWSHHYKKIHFRKKLLYDMRSIGKHLFHKTNQIEMMSAIIPVSYFSDDRFELIEIPYSDRDYVLGILLSKDYVNMDKVDYTPNNVPIPLCGELDDMIDNLEEKSVDITIPIWSQSRTHGQRRAQITVINGTRSPPEVIADEEFVASHIFVFYVRYVSKDIIVMMGDYQG